MASENDEQAIIEIINNNNCSGYAIPFLNIAIGLRKYPAIAKHIYYCAIDDDQINMKHPEFINIILEHIDQENIEVIGGLVQIAYENWKGVELKYLSHRSINILAAFAGEYKQIASTSIIEKLLDLSYQKHLWGAIRAIETSCPSSRLNAEPKEGFCWFSRPGEHAALTNKTLLQKDVVKGLLCNANDDILLSNDTVRQTLVDLAVAKIKSKFTSETMGFSDEQISSLESSPKSVEHFKCMDLDLHLINEKGLLQVKIAKDQDKIGRLTSSLDDIDWNEEVEHCKAIKSISLDERM